jgi:hypothetical protein
MTNILSILGEVNGGGGRVYGDGGELGGFRAKKHFQLRIVDSGLRILEGDTPSGRLPIEERDFGLIEPAAADPATAGHSRAPKKWEKSGKFPGNGGKGNLILLGK